MRSRSPERHVERHEAVSSPVSHDRIHATGDAMGLRLTRSYFKHITPSPAPYPPKDTPDLESQNRSAAIREGPAPVLFSRECFGLCINNVAVGWVHAMISRAEYPFFNHYLHMDGFQLLAAFTLINLPFSMKTFFAILSDGCPLFGYRRRPYMIMGWLLTGLGLGLCTVVPLDESYLDPLTHEVQNVNAPAQGLTYICLLILATTGIALAMVADDGMMVELAQREPESSRGQLQSTIYFLRMFSGGCAYVFTGIVFNGREYGGSSSWSLSFPMVMGLAAIVSWATIPFTWFYLHEPRMIMNEDGQDKLTTTTRMTVRSRSCIGQAWELWELVQKRAIWQVMVFFFVSGFFFSWGCTPQPIVKKVWAKVEPLTESICAIVGSAIFSFSLLLARRYCLQMSWRVILLSTCLLVVSLDSVVSMLTIFNVYRNQWFWLGVPILEQIPGGVNYLIASLIVVEIAEPGYESSTYALITTVKNLTGPFAGTISKNVNAYFHAFQDDVEQDTPNARLHVMYCFALMYVMHLAGNLWLFLLPRQKHEAQALRQCGGKNPVAGALVIGTFIFALLWSIVTNVFAIVPSTACLRIAGGPGCQEA